MAFVHNLIAGSFTWVGDGTDNGGKYLPTPRYTPYHFPHSTTVAGFMTILHGDMRFFNNIFVQQDIRNDYAEHAIKYGTDKNYNLICGTAVYDGYPSKEDFLSRFGPWTPDDENTRDKYYEKLPVESGGNIYFNGARPFEGEKDAYRDEEHKIELLLKEIDGRPVLDTNLFDYLPESYASVISSVVLGKAFEPEQRFEEPDGSGIIFDEDYFGDHRGVHPQYGPFEDKIQAEKPLF